MIRPLKQFPNQLLRTSSPAGESALTLDALRPGEVVRVASLDADVDLRRHLLEMGFTPGCSVTYFMETPFRDPKVFLLRGTRIALRRMEARCVRVST
jgi:Fe2+ transport system protein FeoA